MQKVDLDFDSNFIVNLSLSDCLRIQVIDVSSGKTVNRERYNQENLFEDTKRNLGKY